MKRRILSLLCAVSIISSLTGCNKQETNNSAETTTAAETTAEHLGIKVFKPTADYVKLLGRAYYDDFDEETICAYSGTGCEFTFNGTSANITVTGDSAAKAGNNDNAARFAIYVNGERTQDIMLDEEEKTINVYEGEGGENVTVSLVKLSETANSTLSISSIEVNGGEIKPTSEKELYIEFIGDSITCGYGVDDEDRNHHFSTSTEDCTKAYAYKTAEKLEAD